MTEPLQPAEVLHETEGGRLTVGIRRDHMVMMHVPGTGWIEFSPTQARALSKLLAKKAKEAETYEPNSPAAITGRSDVGREVQVLLQNNDQRSPAD